MGTEGAFTGDKTAGGMKVNTHLHLTPRLRMSGVVPLRPLYAFMAWIGTNLLLPFTLIELK